MATVNHMTEKDYLREVYIELEGIKKRIEGLREDLVKVSGNGGRLYREHERHLLELEEYVEWKLQVLEKGTGFDWKEAGAAVESIVSVIAPEQGQGPEMSGGYLGG